MPSSNNHVASLVKARVKLVERRRAEAERAGTASNIDECFLEIVKYQQAIEVLDRAIADEVMLEKKPYTADDVQ
ncbi:hypothetical protein QO002_006357 [Pararhizobium capsulatum DSM 1112]|uniref:Uncharacterized protein n=1 Tax=Pararhizobium capsulatum DSM 1112 TaxID=1121113 RepID=A0ABU0C0U2_9HYPH|nr:hypothetical protein [Pararhizobium capsulatum]MDQ0324150.1 hypothetical protein [Pararhizobium capsulatum DSM 1112]